jgi:hypothetical protein
MIPVFLSRGEICMIDNGGGLTGKIFNLDPGIRAGKSCRRIVIPLNEKIGACGQS